VLRRPLEPGQYASLAFGSTLRESGLLASMGSRGDAYDNAAAESFMATIKTELVKRTTFKTRDAARLALFEYIETFYNPLRRHSSLGYKSPVEFEQIYSAEMKEAAAAQALTCPRKRVNSNSSVLHWRRLGGGLQHR